MLEAKSIMGQFAEVVPEHLLVEIPEEMERLDAYVGSLESALQETPEILQSVRVNLPVNVPLGMVNHLMPVVHVLQTVVGKERIGVDRAARFDVGANLGFDGVLAPIADDSRTNFSAAFQHPNDGGFVLCASLSNPAAVFVAVHVASGPTDESFVYLDFATRAAHLHKRAGLHRKANPVQHEPCGLLSDAKSAGHFVGTHAVLAVGNHPNGDKPLVEGQSGILEDGSHLDRELPMVVDALALPLSLILEKHRILAPASGADHNASRPAELDHELEAVIGVCKVDDCLLEGLGLFHVSHLNPEYRSPSDLSSILLPLQNHWT